ncbi:MAG: MFS transporter [Nitrososphaeria archaeon]
MVQTAPPEKLNFLFYRFLSSKGFTAAAVTSFIIFYMWMIVSKYRSVALAGVIITIYLAVELSFSIPVGHLIDRVNNTKLNFISTFFIIAGFSILIFTENLLWIYISAAISVLGQTLKTDSFSAIIKKHLPEESFRKANSVNTAASSLSSLSGTIVGGLFIIAAPGYFAYFLVAISIVSLLVSFPSQEKSFIKATGLSTTGEIRSVFAFLRKMIPFLIIALTLNGLFISVDTYSSGLFYLILKSTPLYYTIFSLSVPIGMTAGAPLANFGPLKIDSPLTVSLLVFLFAPLILILSIGRSPLLDIADGLIIGLILPLINIPLFTRLMKIIPYGIYGKTQAFLKVFTSGTSPVMGQFFRSLPSFSG